MCGFVGVRRFDGRAPDAALLQRMSDVIAPRGPDAHGMFQQGPFAVAHRRLKVIDLSEHAQQPMVDRDLGLTLVFNGCIYNYPELRTELQQLGYRFASSGDTEVVLKAFHAWGQNAWARLQGMFAVVVHERDTGRLTLARDRFGIKPLYLAQTPGGLRFGSSLPALIQDPEIDRSIDLMALNHYLSWHAVVPPPLTLLKGVRKFLDPDTALVGVWSDLFAMLVDTALEADAEDIGWGLVNLFHRAAQRKSSAVDRATDEVRALVATNDGSEVLTHDLETQIERAQCAEASMVALEEIREVAAGLFLNEFGSSWKPVSSSRFNHSAMMTSALVESRDFLRARAEAKRRAAVPEGTPVVFAGGRTRHATEDDALTFGNNVWATLDKVRDRVPDMVLIHGGDTKGVDRLASSWAERRGIPQVTFSLDMRLGARAGFKRNERMLSLDPRYVVAFPGNGVLERLVIEAKARRITVVDRRGPLGTSPKAPPG